MTPLWLRLAVRELRGGLTGLRLLAVCLFLGVAAIAGVGSLSSSIVAAIDEQGQTLLGADVEVRFSSRAATPDQRAAFEALGTVSEGVRMRSMVRPTGTNPNPPILAELKAVDGAYPLYGRAALATGTALQTALRGDSVVVAQAIADQLGLKPGDRVEIGAAMLTVGGVLTEEPDRAGQGFSLGPTAMVSLATLAKTGVDAPGSLYTRAYRIKLPAGADATAIEPQLETRFPDAGWDIRDRSNGAPGVQRFVERLGQFLTLVGLTALVVAGVGVGNGVASYLDTKSTGIASLKSLGATSGLI
ncbi:MAG: ABC transporter permease, partial [Alphaproteobacteria bacterium]|nr:ABC transporter permease [Alphaproteobacteria bacterium]